MEWSASLMSHVLIRNLPCEGNNFTLSTGTVQRDLKQTNKQLKAENPYSIHCFNYWWHMYFFLIPCNSRHHMRSDIHPNKFPFSISNYISFSYSKIEFKVVKPLLCKLPKLRKRKVDFSYFCYVPLYLLPTWGGGTRGQDRNDIKC